MGNLVAIVGRPNVGKSTLFNRLTESRTAIVSDVAGTTRDRQYGHVIWNGREFSLVDTGGWVVNSEDIFEDEINKQVEIAIEEADVILFLVDIRNGITDLDESIAHLLRKSGKEIIVVANKADNYDQHAYAAEFYSFGLGDPYIISSANGSGTGDLLDEVVGRFKKDDTEDLEDLPKFAIVGRPNAGKSSLLNAFTPSTTSSVSISIWSIQPVFARRTRSARISNTIPYCVPSVLSRIRMSASL